MSNIEGLTMKTRDPEKWNTATSKHQNVYAFCSSATRPVQYTSNIEPPESPRSSQQVADDVSDPELDSDFDVDSDDDDDSVADPDWQAELQTKVPILFTSKSLEDFIKDVTGKSSTIEGFQVAASRIKEMGLAYNNDNIIVIDK